MPRRALCLLLLLLSSPVEAPAQPSLHCEQDLAAELRGEGPTDVALDSRGRIYILYGRAGRMDVLSPQGQRLQQRGGEAEGPPPPDRLSPLSLWVGPAHPPVVLVSERGQRIASWVLSLEGGRLAARALRGAPEVLEGQLVLAPGPEHRLYVLAAHRPDESMLYGFGGSGGYQYRLRLPPFQKPTQMALDRHRNLYILDRRGLHVYTRKGKPRYSVPGARAFYLAGDDRLLVVGEKWVRKYHTNGTLKVETDPPEAARGMEPVACSLTANGSMFVYYRDPAGGEGVVVGLDPTGYPRRQFPQPARFPPSPDPGIRLSETGKLLLWDFRRDQLVRLHPAGEEELRLGFVPPPRPRGFLVNPTDLAIDSKDVVWIADAGNHRLQRFHVDWGWFQPVPVGIRGGSRRAEPRQVEIDSRGHVVCVVYPPAGKGPAWLQWRDRAGRLLRQVELGDALGEPLFKIAASPGGGLYLYRTGGSPASPDYRPNPQLVHLDARGKRLASVGGEDYDFYLPGRPRTRVELKPEAEMVPWRHGLILPAENTVLFLDDRLRATHQVRVEHRRRAPGAAVLPDFAGAAVFDDTLYLCDVANRCLHRIPLPDRL